MQTVYSEFFVGRKTIVTRFCNPAVSGMGKRRTEAREEPSGPFAKVAECLDLHVGTSRYYAFVKRGGKQFRRSLKTTGRQLANRRLADYREEVQRLTDDNGPRCDPR